MTTVSLHFIFGIKLYCSHIKTNVGSSERARGSEPRRGSVVLMISTACHATGRQFAPRTRNMTLGIRGLLGVKTWLSTLEVSSDGTLKAIGPFHMVSMPGEVKYPT